MTTTTTPKPITRPAPSHAELEASLEAYFRKAVRAAGGLIYKLAPTVSGIPDRLVIFPGGLMFLVELKAPGGRLSPIQEHVHSELAAVGTTVAVLEGRGQVDSWISSRFAGIDRVENRGGRRIKGVKVSELPDRAK